MCSCSNRQSFYMCRCFDMVATRTRQYQFDRDFQSNRQCNCTQNDSPVNISHEIQQKKFFNAKNIYKHHKYHKWLYELRTMVHNVQNKNWLYQQSLIIRIYQHWLKFRPRNMLLQKWTHSNCLLETNNITWMLTIIQNILFQYIYLLQ